MDIQQFFAQIMKSRRGPEKMTDLEQLQQIVTHKANVISQRAAIFVRELFQSENIRNENFFESWQYSIPKPSKSPVCSKTMGGAEGGPSFRCFQCMQSSSSCICEQCFIAGDHKGHNYLQYNSTHGCCDCGNEQAWNQKGFCSAHAAIKQVDCQIPQSTRTKFMEQSYLVLFVYFYLLQKAPKRKSLLEQYGNHAFKHLTRASHDNYQLKLLASQLLESKFPQDYPYIPHRNFKLIEIFFRLPSQQVRSYPQLINWIFETFPVESMRKKIIREYFQKMRRLQDELTAQCPLAGLNFQYCSSVKLITKMIKNNQLQPFQAPIMKISGLQQQKILNIPLIFKKLYQDMDYINNMKSAKQYHILHLQTTNIAHMASYRQITKIQPSLPFDKDYTPIFNVDEMFLKTINKFINNAKQNKAVIAKSMAEVFHYIFNAGQNAASMAQERSFSMLLLAYLDGDIMHLTDQNKRDQVIGLLGVEKDKFRFMLESIIKATLKTTINLATLPEPPETSYQRFFLKTNSQKNLPLYCDLVFWKSLILLSHNIVDFGQVVLEQVKEKIDKIEKGDTNKLSSEQDSKTIATGIVLRTALNLSSLSVRLTHDQTVINYTIGIVNKPQIFALFSRMLTTFPQATPKQLKNLCIQIVNNDQLFQQFIKTHAILQKGRFKLKSRFSVPFEFIIFEPIFKKHSKNLSQAQAVYLNGKESYPKFQSYLVFNRELVNIAIQYAMELISLLADDKKQLLQSALNNIVKEIFSLYLLCRSQQFQYFFRTLLNPSLRPFFQKNLLQQITLIERNEDELKLDLQKIKNQEAEQFKAKREKVMAKKKMKEDIMKKQQEQMLYKYFKGEDNSSMKPQQSSKFCIFCKQETNEPLNLIGYIGLSNLIESSLLSRKQFHYFFSSCGHHIHTSCYIQANDKQSKNFCFLCKQHTNILIPQLNELNKQLQIKQSQKFINNIFMAVINDHQLDNGKIGQFQNLVFDNHLGIVIESVAKELAFNGLHDYELFSKKGIKIYRNIIQMINNLPKQTLQPAFMNIRSKWTERVNNNQQKHRIEVLQRRFELQIEQSIMQYSLQTQLQQNQLEPHITEQQNNLWSIISNQQSGPTTFTSLQEINLDSIFIKIPQSLSELHQYMGKCKLCPNTTNNIFLCLVCGWSACIKCVKLIFEHVSLQHIEGAIVIGCSTGAVKYFMGKDIFEDASIYQNYLGLSFSQAQTYNQYCKAEKYSLNLDKERQIRKKMLHHEVHQKIHLNGERYRQ